MTQAQLNPIYLVTILLLSACAGKEQPTSVTETESDATVLYEDNFEDGESCFNLEVSPDVGVLSIERGEFTMGVNRSRALVYATCEGLVLDNFRLDMDVIDDTSDSGFRFYGLQFRKQSSEGPADVANSHYLFRLGQEKGTTPASCAGLATNRNWLEDLTESPDGDSCWVDLSESIPAGQWVHHTITADGPELTYAVNDVVVARVSDSRLSQGAIALFVGAHEAENVRVRIDNFRITALK